MIVYTSPKAATAIPIIDLSGGASGSTADRARIAAQIRAACCEIGFFYVTNHGIDAGLLDAQFAATRQFFALPLDQKLSIHMKQSPSTAGYEPIGGQWLDSQDANAEVAPPDVKESYYLGAELPASHPFVQARSRGFGFNQWPSGLPGFREQMLRYQSAVHELGDALLSLIAQSLEQPDDFFAPFFDTPSETLRLLRYPPHPANAQPNQLGAGAHTDWGGITLLAQDERGGLEVQNVAGDWVDATPVSGTLVVNLGDLMSRWTNGIYASNMHRVKNNRSAGDRYSIPYFYSPRPDALIKCIDTCTDGTRAPRFAPVTASEHINEMFRRSYGYAPIA